MAGMIYEKGDPQNVKKTIAEIMTRKFLRHRSKIVKILDNYYFKEISANELK